MCGIVGLIGPAGYRADFDQLKTMTDTLVHRGPDDRGIWTHENVGFGHRRLSIIDIQSGQQPLFNEDRSLAIVFNGEIYNYKELYKRLENKYSFRTKSDTEVILHLYEEYGENCLQYLRGMFAFGIYDIKKEKLFLARDHLGQKPLYYSYHQGFFIFASEPKAILASQILKPSLDYNSLDLFFSLLYTPAPNSIWKEIRKLPQASYLVFENGSFEIKKYWERKFNDKFTDPLPVLKERFLETFSEAVQLCMVSDVEVGSFLSGGVDSSSSASFIVKNTSRNLHTFSIFTEGDQDPDYEYANLMAKHLGTNHHNIFIDSHDPSLKKEFEWMMYTLDEPFGKGSVSFLRYLLCREIRKKVKVVISGDGADELYAGYIPYLKLKKMDDFSPLASLIPNFLLESRVKSNALAKALYVAKLSKEKRQGFLYNLKYSNFISKIFNNQFRENVSSNIQDVFAQCYRNSKAKSYLDAVLYTDITLTNYHDIQMADASSMAYGLEVRSAFFDHKVAEFAARLPTQLLLKDGKNKSFLKYAFSDVLPDPIINRRKSGFSGGAVRLFLHHWKDEIIDRILNGSYLNEGIFNRDTIENIVRSENSFSKNMNMLWCLYSLSVWYEMNLTGVPVTPDSERYQSLGM